MSYLPAILAPDRIVATAGALHRVLLSGMMGHRLADLKGALTAQPLTAGGFSFVICAAGGARKTPINSSQILNTAIL